MEYALSVQLFIHKRNGSVIHFNHRAVPQTMISISVQLIIKYERRQQTMSEKIVHLNLKKMSSVYNYYWCKIAKPSSTA